MELPPSYTFLHPANTPKNIREGERKKERTERARERERAERSSFRFRARLSSILTILRPSSSALIISCPLHPPPLFFCSCDVPSTSHSPPKKGPFFKSFGYLVPSAVVLVLLSPTKSPFPGDLCLCPLALGALPLSLVSPIDFPSQTRVRVRIYGPRGRARLGPTRTSIRRQ